MTSGSAEIDIGRKIKALLRTVHKISCPFIIELNVVFSITFHFLPICLCRFLMRSVPVRSNPFCGRRLKHMFTVNTG